MSDSNRIQNRIAPLNERLRSHPLYDAMRTVEDVQVFMENHVFAVWDFMTILKSLQRALTCVDTIWVPSSNPQARRLINEIVLCEESDEDGEGGYASHFEMYLRAMERCEASTTQIEEFVAALRKGTGPLIALENARIPDCTRQFVYRTLSTATHSQSCELAASFAYGREHLLPEVFDRVIDEVGELGNQRLGYFVDYLRRHIEVDGDSHGPMAEEMISHLCGDSSLRWQLAEQAAVRAVEARIRLWDGVLAQIETRNPTHSEQLSFEKPNDRFLEAAIRLGWIDGLSTDEIGKQLQMSTEQVEAIVSGSGEIAG
ncbi:MAG TPA: hypothetical protein DEF45_24205 [Rhodopirellula sp.]|nr:MAG: hypothetical protein CBD74_00420 [Saprospirales bacterium TMED214]HBV66118.1 hypothetical protein [Rhodopirellula sp.]